MYTKLASSIYNDVMSGLRGYTSNISMSLDQLEDEIVDERLTIIKEYSLKGILPTKDLYYTINCIETDCKSLDGCANACFSTKPIVHFEIPQIVNDYGEKSIEYLGSPDHLNQFIIINSHSALKANNYRKRGKNKPTVFINTSPNENNMYDCYVFNAPMLSTISIVAIFKDLRQVKELFDCDDIDIDNMNFIDNEIRRRLIEKKIRWYRQFSQPIVAPNNQTPK